MVFLPSFFIWRIQFLDTSPQSSPLTAFLALVHTPCPHPAIHRDGEGVSRVASYVRPARFEPYSAATNCHKVVRPLTICIAMILPSDVMAPVTTDGDFPFFAMPCVD